MTDIERKRSKKKVIETDERVRRAFRDGIAADRSSYINPHPVRRELRNSIAIISETPSSNILAGLMGRLLALVALPADWGRIGTDTIILCGIRKRGVGRMFSE